MRKNREAYNEYMRDYMRSRYASRRSAIERKLGGKCSICGTAVGPFEVDHIDRTSKELTLDKMCYYSEARAATEVTKCQLLCKPCHVAKTIRDLGQTAAKGTHGTLSSYRYCKCPLCKKAKADHNRAYRKANPRKRACSSAGSSE